MTKEAKQFIAGILSATTFLTMSACAKNAKCDVGGKHSHTYINEEGYKRDYVSEREKIDSFFRLNESKELTGYDAEIIKSANENGLIRIDENIDKLSELEGSVADYRQYETCYTSFSYVKAAETVVVIPHKSYYYINNPEGALLTGKERVITHKFIGYKVTADEVGNTQVIKSEPMDSIEELVDAGYTYVKYGEVYYGLNKDTGNFIGYEDPIGKNTVSELVLKKDE